MGLFGNLFKSEEGKQSEEKNGFQWNQLTSEAQLQDLEEESQTAPVVIFKHSTRCGISRMVLKQFESKHNSSEDVAKFYFLDLLNYRPLSQAIAARYQVVHESPQLILLKSAKVMQHASHHDILNVSL
ncbi:MAG TPA: bacillithiol system redox-active protein YtxJ [Flavobacteriaceae bacterium]|nr:bacillithiol system redox-active protein YtxJ [Flavobacteriaceae bacterium]